VVVVIVFKRGCLWEVEVVKGSKMVGSRGFVEVVVVKGVLVMVAKLLHYFP
jgi:hypothetical protein